MHLQPLVDYQENQKPHAVFTLAGGEGMHKIHVDFLTASRNTFVPISILSDTGSDITLLSREDGERIGFSPERGGEPFLVGGVGAGSVPFRKFATFIRFKNLQPVRVDFGVAQNYGGLRDNLLGREDVLDNYDITFSKSSVTFTPRGMRAMAAMQTHMFRYLP